MNSHKQKLAEANASIEKMKRQVGSDNWRMQYHFSAPAYWINDPNGFVFFQGEYHLFYQHHPYSPHWGPMHWGHAKTKDFVHWQQLPIALAPSEAYDQKGCFSGSAIEKDGKLFLMYTGVMAGKNDEDTDLPQVQCLAVSDDGVQFEKLATNPVIATVPDGNIHPMHVRDPKVWKKGDSYYCVIGSKTKDEVGQILLYRSEDLQKWEFMNIAAKGVGNAGYMWECPDLFHLEGKDILVMSPQGMKPEGELYHNLHQSGYVLGALNEDTGILEHGGFELLDYGFDFYAPQTTTDAQGRRLLIAWMAMWESDMPEQKFGWAGAMTIPRQLKLVNGKLVSRPLPEFMELRKDMIEYKQQTMTKRQKLPGIQGDCLELEVHIDMRQAKNFGIKLRVDEDNQQETVLSYDAVSGFLTFDRNKAGEGPGGIRKAPVSLKNNQLKLRIFLDKSSLEVFVNDGEQVMSGRIYPSKHAVEIVFFADETVEIISLKQWQLHR